MSNFKHIVDELAEQVHYDPQLLREAVAAHYRNELEQAQAYTNDVIDETTAIANAQPATLEQITAPVPDPDIRSMLIHRENEEIIYIALPRALWRPIVGGCSCPYCSTTKDHSQAFWDTLAVPRNPPVNSTDNTWSVHYPELHGATRKR